MRNYTVVLIVCVQSEFLNGSLKALILPTLSKIAIIIHLLLATQDLQ